MSTIQDAISWLKAAGENSRSVDQAAYQKAAKDLEMLFNAALKYDSKLDQDEKAPTGDDYNELFSIVVWNV